MFALVLGLLRARTAQTVTVVLLTVLASAAATASPWYVLASARQAAVAEVDAAPAAQRMLSVRRISATEGDPSTALRNFQSSVRGLLPVNDPHPVLGMAHTLSATAGSEYRDMALAFRDGVCTHLRLTGSCPDAPGQAVISQYSADVLGLDVGDSLTLRDLPDPEPISLRIVGRYELAEPDGPYWSDALFGRGDNAGPGSLDPAFVALGSFADPKVDQATLAYDVPVPDQLIRGDGGYDLAGVLRQTDYRLSAAGFHLVTPAQNLVGLIADDRTAIRLGVLVGAVQVLLLCWFALGLAGRFTARQRRHDLALLKLRGTTRRGIFRLTLGQHLVPMLAGLVVGTGVGYLAARLLAGPVTEPAEVRLAAMLSGLAVAATLLGGLVVLALTEWTALRAPVATLLRQVPPPRRGWRSYVVDVLLIAVAAAGIYQVRTAASNGAAALDLAAPSLAALGVALLVARLLGYLTDRAGRGALRVGRLRLGLTAVQISRRPGIERVLALLVVAVAVFATAASGWAAGSADRAERSTGELGASRVLTVQATNRTALLYAVRQADPSGRDAMAVVVNRMSVPPVLAVDAARLPAVAAWQGDYGSVTALAADVARGDGPGKALTAVTGAALTLRARNNSGQPVGVMAQFENQATGAAVSVAFDAIGPGEHEVSAPVRGCAAPGCRLLRLELVTDGRPAPSGSSLTVLGLTQQNPAGSILDSGSLSDPRRWRADTSGLGLTVLARDGGLSLATAAADPTVEFPMPESDNQVYVVNTPLPLPVVLAGTSPQTWLLGDATLDPFGGGSVSIRVASTAAMLPVLGRTGVLLDLGTTQQLVANDGLGGTFQVWLASSAPDSVVDRLRAGGLTVLVDDSLAARQEKLAEQGPAVAVRFQLLAAAIGLLLAAAALSVSVNVERNAGSADLRALRTQGLSQRVAVAAGYAGYAAVVAVGALGGLLASVVAHYLTTVDGPPLVGDRPPDGPHLVALAVAGGVALAVLALAWWTSVAPLGRELRDGGVSRLDRDARAEGRPSR